MREQYSRQFYPIYGFHHHLCGTPSTLCDTPSTLCGTPSTLCGTPSTLCGTPSTLCDTPSTLCSTLCCGGCGGTRGLPCGMGVLRGISGPKDLFPSLPVHSKSAAGSRIHPNGREGLWSTPSTLCSTPSTLCSIPSTLCTTHSTLCSTPSTLCSTAGTLMVYPLFFLRRV